MLFRISSHFAKRACLIVYIAVLINIPLFLAHRWNDELISNQPGNSSRLSCSRQEFFFLIFGRPWGYRYSISDHFAVLGSLILVSYMVATISIVTGYLLFNPNNLIYISKSELISYNKIQQYCMIALVQCFSIL